MHAACVCVRVCVVLMVVLLICGCFYCTLICLTSRMHTCIPVVCIYVCGRGEGVGWVGEVLLCGCVSKRCTGVRVCLNSCIFNLRLN